MNTVIIFLCDNEPSEAEQQTALTEIGAKSAYLCCNRFNTWTLRTKPNHFHVTIKRVTKN